ncbi:MAG: hypothetical protein P4L35_13880 [Ignavibacteriaceae bacterium]|nr:hypothetical protein [Ignavibacteriaceae bacterium]
MNSNLNQLKQFKKPHDIQLFLNKLRYNPDKGTNSPGKVLRLQKANCFEGALFAAAALRELGHKPLIVDLMAVNDDDHIVALFKHNNCFGAVAKSNTTMLRFREPVFKTLKELILSFFEFYFNTIGEKTLRSYSNPVNLARFDKLNWMFTDDNLDYIGDYLYFVKHHRIMDRKTQLNLSIADGELIDLCFAGSVPEGLYTPKKKRVYNRL